MRGRAVVPRRARLSTAYLGIAVLGIQRGCEHPAKPVYDCHELLRVGRFGHMEVDAGLLGTTAVFILVEAGDGHEQGLALTGLLPEPPGDLKAAQSRQPDVQENQVRRRLPGQP
jgi:hypothetical protein